MIELTIDKENVNYHDNPLYMNEFFRTVQHTMNCLLNEVKSVPAYKVVETLGIYYIPPSNEYWATVEQGWYVKEEGNGGPSEIILDIDQDQDEEGHLVYKIKLNCSSL